MWKGKQKAKVSLPTIYKVLTACFQPAVPLCLILRFPLRYRLPLHIERCICSTAFERIDVIDHVSGTAAAGSPVSRTRMLTFEVVLSSGAASVAAMVGRPRTVRAEGRAMAMSMPRSGEESRQSRSAIDLKRTLSPSAPEDSTATFRPKIFPVTNSPRLSL